MSLPIEIEGALSIQGPGLAATVRGRGRDVVCDLSDLSMLWSLLKRARQAQVISPSIQAMLEGTDVRLSIHLRGRVIAEAGPGIATGRLAGLFGLTGMRFRSFRNPNASSRKAP